MYYNDYTLEDLSVHMSQQEWDDMIIEIELDEERTNYELNPY